MIYISVVKIERRAKLYVKWHRTYPNIYLEKKQIYWNYVLYKYIEMWTHMKHQKTANMGQSDDKLMHELGFSFHIWKIMICSGWSHMVTGLTHIHTYKH